MNSSLPGFQSLSQAPFHPLHALPVMTDLLLRGLALAEIVIFAVLLCSSH
jgi:hypothetical protein